MKWWHKISLFLIFILAFIIRIWNVSAHPTFISDEASIGYNAYSILKTGKDEWGKFLPLTFKSFGEYKLPVYIYVAVPSVAIFGLNEFATRLPSLFFGSLTVLLIFLLVQKLFSSFYLSLITCLFLAISPWHIQVSRMALEANLSLFLTVLAVVLLLKADQQPKLYYFSFFLFALTFYTYNSSRIFTPLFLLAWFLRQRKKVVLSKILKPVVLGLILLLPVIFSGFAGSRERLHKVGIFADPGIIAQINEQRGDCQKKILKPICVFRYNKPVVYTQVFVKNYLSHFSWKFLFKEGSGLAQYGVPGYGVLYIWELPFLIIGLIYLLKLKKEFGILLSWILIAPLANSLTGIAHPVRAILMLPIFQIFSAAGVVASINFLSRRIYFRYLYSLLLILIIGIFMVAFGIRYFVLYPMVADWNWQMGYKDLYRQLSKIESQSNKIYVSKFYGEPHIFYLFYRQFDPSKYQKGENVLRYDRKDRWVNVDKIGQYYFVQEPRKVSLGNKDLLALPLQEFSFEGKILKTIKYRNGQTAFLILEKWKKTSI